MASPFFNIVPSLLFESERLKTFFELKEDGTPSGVKLWSSAADITPEELAKDGFYFLKEKDHCACIFCRGIIGQWIKGDTVRGEHQRHFGTERHLYGGCRFVKGDPIGNVPMTLSEHLVPLWRETVLKRIEDNNKNPSIISPDFSLLDKREASFESSPFSTDMRKKLSAAGFYSCLDSDHVRCFRCNLGLRNWLETMDPLEKHAEYSPGCIMVKLSDASAKTHVDKRRNSSAKIKKVNDALVDLVIKEGDIERHMLSMGFPQEAVKEAVKNRLLDTGIKFYDMIECIEHVIFTMEFKAMVRANLKRKFCEMRERSDFGEQTMGLDEKEQEKEEEEEKEDEEEGGGSSSALGAEGWEDGATQSPLILTKSIRKRLPHRKHALIMPPSNSTVSMRRCTAAESGVGHPSRSTPFVFSLASRCDS